MTVDGKRLGLGIWATEREAALAYDRAAVHYLGREARRNFPRSRPSAADAEALREEARRRFKLETASIFRGVFAIRKRWEARINHDHKHDALGAWGTQWEAAEAYDRAARFFFGREAQLNFPRRRLPALSPAAIRRLSRLARKAEAHYSSKYLGVRFMDQARPWVGELTPLGGTHLILGSWTSEPDAARAYDRAARFYFGPRAELNFPGESVEPADAPTLAAEARRQTKLACTSEYVGVTWGKKRNMWRAAIGHEGRYLYLGDFARELEAAHAYDAKSRQLRGRLARINFHPATGERVFGKRIVDLPANPAARRVVLRSPSISDQRPAHTSGAPGRGPLSDWPAGPRGRGRKTPIERPGKTRRQWLGQ
jgi:hypothetical protein